MGRRGVIGVMDTVRRAIGALVIPQITDHAVPVIGDAHWHGVTVTLDPSEADHRVPRPVGWTIIAMSTQGQAPVGVYPLPRGTDGRDLTPGAAVYLGRMRDYSSCAAIWMPEHYELACDNQNNFEDPAMLHIWHFDPLRLFSERSAGWTGTR